MIDSLHSSLPPFVWNPVKDIRTSLHVHVWCGGLDTSLCCFVTLHLDAASSQLRRLSSVWVRAHENSPALGQNSVAADYSSQTQGVSWRELARTLRGKRTSREKLRTRWEQSGIEHSSFKLFFDHGLSLFLASFFLWRNSTPLQMRYVCMFIL